MYLKYITFQRNPSIKFVRVLTKNTSKKITANIKKPFKLSVKMTTLSQVCLKSFKEIDAE